MVNLQLQLQLCRCNLERSSSYPKRRSQLLSRVLSLPPTFRGYNADGEMLLGPNSGDGNQQINFDKFVRDNNTRQVHHEPIFYRRYHERTLIKSERHLVLFRRKNMLFNKDYLSSPGNWVTSTHSTSGFLRTHIGPNLYNAVLNYNYQINKDHYLDAMAASSTTTHIIKVSVPQDRELPVTLSAIWNIPMTKANAA